jgi:hypothetical protein
MGATRDDFVKYPRTPHLFGSKGTDDDKPLGPAESERPVNNVGVTFAPVGISPSTPQILRVKCASGGSSYLRITTLGFKSLTLSRRSWTSWRKIAVGQIRSPEK